MIICLQSDGLPTIEPTFTESLHHAAQPGNNRVTFQIAPVTTFS